MSLFHELKRRNVFRVALAYTVIAWLVMQVGDTMGPALRLPDWVPSLLAFLLILGFPIAIFFAWTFELTADGLHRDGEVEQRPAERARSDKRLNVLTLVVLVFALGYFLTDRFVLTQPDSTRVSVEAEEIANSEPVAVQGPARHSIAVLPFINMSSDSEQEYFSDGLTEELLNLLADIGELKVAARTSSFFYKDKLDSIPLLDIARQLEVAHVLEGSVRKSGDKIRITAQLIKAEDGFHLWSETYDRKLDDVFAVQDEIAAAVTRSLKVTLLGEAPKTKILDPRSFEHTLQARFLFNRRAEGDLQRALELFQQAAELDPSNATAWVGMVPLYLWLYDPPRISEARHAAESALQLEPDNPEAHIRLAYVLYSEGRYTKGLESLQRAFSLGPENPLILSMIAGRMDHLGEHEQAIEYQARAITADPLHIVNLCNMGSFLIRANRLDEAKTYASKALELAPQGPLCIDVMGAIHLLQGRARETLEFASMLGGDSVRPGVSDQQSFLQALAYFSMGDLERSQRNLEAFRLSFGDESPLEMAYIHAWRNEPDLAFEWIERSFKQDTDTSRSPLEHTSRAILTHPILLSLHDDPRWLDVVAHWSEEDIAREASLFR